MKPTEKVARYWQSESGRIKGKKVSQVTILRPLTFTENCQKMVQKIINEPTLKSNYTLLREAQAQSGVQSESGGIKGKKVSQVTIQRHLTFTENCQKMVQKITT